MISMLFFHKICIYFENLNSMASILCLYMVNDAKFSECDIDYLKISFLLPSYRFISAFVSVRMAQRI